MWHLWICMRNQYQPQVCVGGILAVANDFNQERWCACGTPACPWLSGTSTGVQVLGSAAFGLYLSLKGQSPVTEAETLEIAKGVTSLAEPLSLHVPGTHSEQGNLFLFSLKPVTDRNHNPLRILYCCFSALQPSECSCGFGCSLSLHDLMTGSSEQHVDLSVWDATPPGGAGAKPDIVTTSPEADSDLGSLPAYSLEVS